MPKGRTWDKIKSHGKKTESIARDVKDSFTNFFARDDVKTKLSDIEDSFRSVRDKVTDHFKTKPNKSDIDSHFNSLEESVKDLSKSQENFDENYSKIMNALFNLNSTVDEQLKDNAIVDNHVIDSEMSNAIDETPLDINGKVTQDIGEL